MFQFGIDGKVFRCCTAAGCFQSQGAEPAELATAREKWQYFVNKLKKYSITNRIQQKKGKEIEYNRKRTGNWLKITVEEILRKKLSY